MDRTAQLHSVCRDAEIRARELNLMCVQAARRRAEIRERRSELKAQMAVRRAVLQTDSRRAAAAILEAAFGVSGMTFEDLWMEYFALTGDLTPDELRAALSGEIPLYWGDHDRLALILNARLSSRTGAPVLPYWYDGGWTDPSDHDL